MTAVGCLAATTAHWLRSQQALLHIAFMLGIAMTHTRTEQKWNEKRNVKKRQIKINSQREDRSQVYQHIYDDHCNCEAVQYCIVCRSPEYPLSGPVICEQILTMLLGTYQQPFNTLSASLESRHGPRSSSHVQRDRTVVLRQLMRGEL